MGAKAAKQQDALTELLDLLTQNGKKQEAAERALEYQRTMNPDAGEKYNPSRVGDRPFARGRGYDPDRYSFNGMDGSVADTSSIDEELDEAMKEKLQKAAEASSMPETEKDVSAAEAESSKENDL